MRVAPCTAALLAVVAGAADARDVAWVERRVGDLHAAFPSGGDWQGGPQGEDGWAALRVREDADGNPVLLQIIGLVPAPLPPTHSDWLPVEVATDYLPWEIENLRTEGVAAGAFDLVELDVFEVERAGRTLHALRNVKSFIEPWDPNLTREVQELYLAFPADFANDTTFYKIFLTVDCFQPTCAAEDLDLQALYPILDSLRDAEAPRE